MFLCAKLPWRAPCGAISCTFDDNEFDTCSFKNAFKARDEFVKPNAQDTVCTRMSSCAGTIAPERLQKLRPLFLIS